MDDQMIVWKPVGKMIVVKKDDDKETTSGGIILPSESKIPVITCVVVAIGPQVDIINFPIVIYDRILVAPTSAIPISFESDNKRYVLDSEKIMAIQDRKATKEKKKNKSNEIEND